MVEIHGTQEIANDLDHLADIIDGFISIKVTRVVLNVTAALMAFALMVNMTAQAGLSGLKPLMRLVQRCALGWLSFSLMLRAVTPLVASGKHNSLIGLVTSASLVFLFAASLVLVAMNPAEHERQ